MENHQGLQLVLKYFPDLTTQQLKQFKLLEEVYIEWNQKINVISRKDVDDLFLKHILHSLAIAKYITFPDGARILDIGTGGGFPGIPLSILFPKSNFHLVDSIGKKITVVNEAIKALNIDNVVAEQMRAEKSKQKYHFVVTRAVTGLPTLKFWVKRKFEGKSFLNCRRNGLICLKGGDLTEEIKSSKLKVKEIAIQKFFNEEFFETKKIIYINSKQLN